MSEHSRKPIIVCVAREFIFYGKLISNEQIVRIAKMFPHSWSGSVTRHISDSSAVVIIMFRIIEQECENTLAMPHIFLETHTPIWL